MIGIFDSGMGGLSVARAIRQKAPSVDMVYFGDIANMPYGTKDLAALERLTFNAMRALRQAGATHIVSACNTASTSVIRPMLDLFGIGESSMTEMVEPSVKYLQSRVADRIVVVATPATVRSAVYQKSFQRAGLNAHMIASPDLASAIEFGESEDRVRQKVDALVTQALRLGCDTLMMGSTHYALVKEMFREQLIKRGSNCFVFDPAEAVADHAFAAARELGSGKTQFILSRDSENFRAYAERYFPSADFSIYSPNVAA